MGSFTRDAFLKAIGSKPLFEVTIKDYDMTCYIGKLSAAERSEILKNAVLEAEDGKHKTVPVQDQMCLTLRAALRDADGSRGFQDTPEDLKILLDMDGEVIDVLFNAAIDFNGMSQKALPKAIKNSEASRN
jgi:hypothetical protein